jgi:hypothetical protein
MLAKFLWQQQMASAIAGTRRNPRLLATSSILEGGENHYCSKNLTMPVEKQVTSAYSGHPPGASA